MPWRAIALCSIVRLVKRRDGLGVKAWQVPILQLSGCRAFVLDRLKRFQDYPSSKSYRVEER